MSGSRLKISRMSSPMLANSLNVGTTMRVCPAPVWPSASEVMTAEKPGPSSHLVSVREQDRAKRKQSDRERQKRLVKPGPAKGRESEHEIKREKNTHVSR